MSSIEPFSASFKTTPYWWDAMSPWENQETTLPAKADVVIVGAGLTGSSAATTLARAGRDVVVIESEQPGYGASARSAGFLSRHFKHSLGDLLKKFEHDVAVSYFHTLQDAYNYTLNLIKSEDIACHLQETGRFIAALNQNDFDVLKQEYALRKQHLGEEFTIVENGGSTEYRSDKVIGGILLREQGSIHPGVYAQSMAKRAVSSGARMFCKTSVLGVQRNGQQFIVSTSKGNIHCNNVIMATNGYSDDAVKWVKRRLIPIRGYQIATEPLPPGLLAELLPFNRTYTDRRKASNFLRPSPDGSRILFGGQTGAMMENRIEEVALKVRAEMIDIFPQLRNIQLSHAWSGRCAATIDMFPKVGVKNGVHFALAYCFSGNVLAPYFGNHVAQKILGVETKILPFEAHSFRAIPLYNGNPWFLPLVQKYYELLDRVR